MTDGIGIVATAQGAVTPTAPLASATAAQSFAQPNAAATLVHSPRLVLDPTAGFITEYLSANGSQIVSQTPSAITVAYLRIGLTAQGLTKQPAPGTQHVGTVA